MTINLYCPKCGNAVAQLYGGLGVVAYERRVYGARQLLGLQCECGGNVRIPGQRSWQLPADFMASEEIRCPTPDCANVLGRTSRGQYVIVAYRHRLLACKSLLYVECEVCGQAHGGGEILGVEQSYNSPVLERIRRAISPPSTPGVCGHGVPAPQPMLRAA